MKISVMLSKQENANAFGVDVGSIVLIELSDYLVGVVASEIGNASLEACKAQAVASRTMAYPYYSHGKPVSDSSSKLQCFSASRMKSDKYPNAIQAVRDTEGELLFYMGKVIVPSSYSSSNGGRTVSSKERWGGERAWLIAQDDPWDKAITNGKKTGHGVGMSQSGAKYAASIGKTYEEILSFYYPHTTISKDGNHMAYATVKASWLVEKFYTMVVPGKEWKYVAGGAQEGAVDCSGAFTYWYKKAGSFMYHGSNTMWRKYTTSKGKVGEIELVPGMAVFKRRAWSEKDSTNTYYGDSIGNFYHVGCYAGNGKVIEAKGTKYGCVISNLSEWPYAAKLKYSEYDMTEAEDEYRTGTVTTSGGILYLRSEPTTASRYLKKIPNGTKIQVGSACGDNDEWLKAVYDGASGYVSAKYISFGKTYTVTVTTTSKEASDKILEYAKSVGAFATVKEDA